MVPKFIVCKFLTIKFLLFYSLNFRSNKNGLVCTSKTAKKLSNMSHWTPNTGLSLYGLLDTFNIADFCALIKKGVFEKVELCASRHASMEYKNAFKIAIEEMKKLPEIKTQISFD